MTVRRQIPALAFAALLGVAGCDSGCSPTDVSCGSAVPTYEILLVDPPGSLSALVLRVTASGQPIELLLSSSGVQSYAAGNAGGTEWRGVVLGKPVGNRIGTLTSATEPGSLPIATVIEASAGAAENYAVLTGTITLEVRRVN